MEGVIRCSISIRLINSVGSVRADGLSQEAQLLLQRLDAQAAGHDGDVCRAACNLATSCLHLHDEVDTELVASMEDCFSESDMLIWGFSLDVAETIAFALAAVAAATSFGSIGDSSAAHVERLCAQLDLISVHIFGGLCRSAFGIDGSEGERRLTYAFKVICMWILALLHRMMGGLTAQAVWELAGGDPLWALLLIKGALQFNPDASVEAVVGGQLLVPPERHALKEAVIVVLGQIASHGIAFFDEVDANVIADDLDGGFTMAERLVALSVHRARLSAAAGDCQLVPALLQELTTAKPGWLPPALSFLAALLQPPHDEPAIWDKILQEEEEAGSCDVCSLQEARAARETLAWQMTVHCSSTWLMVAGVVPSCIASTGGLSFLWDCATLAHSVPMNSGTCRYFLDCYLRCADRPLDGAWLAPLVALASNCELPPSEEPGLLPALARAGEEARLALCRRLARGRAPLRSGEVLRQWAEALGAPLGLDGRPLPPEPEPLPLEPQDLPPSPAAVPPKPSDFRPPPAHPPPKPRLRDTLRGAPKEICCALDQRLLVDPVRSPYGHVYERSTLAEVLASTPGVCPKLGWPMTLEQCPRDAAVRAQAARWVKQAMQRPR